MTAVTDPARHLAAFGLEEFRPGQRAVIEAVLDGHDCLCIMPTGGGKSLCYQLPAVAGGGITLVISPLIALMKDQVDGLLRRSIPATFINSSLAPQEQQERLRRLAEGEFRLVYVAPERIRSTSFLHAMERLRIDLLAVDEAHCISEWGHDFRPDYARLGTLRKRLGSPQTIALTATATPDVRADVLTQLELREPRIFIHGFARTNLRFEVAGVGNTRDKEQRLLGLLEEIQGAGIIYSATRKACVELYELLEEQTPRRVGFYHAGLPPDERRAVQERFMSGALDTIVATNAFGMGIDRGDLRFVVHYNVPGSLEAYYQEAGRAGRDGQPARCILFSNLSDRFIQQFFIENAYPDRNVIAAVYDFLRLQPDDPIEITLQDLRERLALKIGTEGIGAAEQILEKAGAIKRLDARYNSASVWIDSEDVPLVDWLPKEARVQRKVLRAIEKLVGDRRFERVTFPLPKLEALTGLEKEPLNRALRELRKLKQFDYVPPFRGRAVHVIDRQRRFSELEIDFGELDRRKAAEYEKLDTVFRYAGTHRCRQLEVLEYFGDPSRAACGMCDNCDPRGAAQPRAAVVHTDTERALLQPVRMALSAVARAKGRFGKQVVVQMLCGSKSSKLKHWKLDRLSTFGLFASLRQVEVAELIDQLILHGLVGQNEVDRFRPVVELTEQGRAVMLGKAPLEAPLQLGELVFAKLLAVARRAAREARSDSAHAPSPSRADPPHPSPVRDRGDGEVVRQPHAESQRAFPDADQRRCNPPGQAAIVPDPELPGASTDPEAAPLAADPLASALAEFCYRLAGGAPALPEEVVLGTATQQRLVSQRPASREELAQCLGVAASALGAWADELLDLIARFRPTPASTQPDHYWTWRLLADGYSWEQVLAIRGKAEADLALDLRTALADGFALELDDMLSADQQARLINGE